MPTVYVCFCPAGKECKKGGSRLGAFPDELAARAKIVAHLMNSPFHNYDQGTADGFAEGAELTEEEAPPEPDHKPMNKWGWKEDKQWRAGPYEASWGKGGGKGGSGGSSSSTALAITGKDSGIVAAVARAEAAARTAARMAHAAASAFEAEASILRDSLDSLQKR